MEFIFDLLAEVILTPIIEVYLLFASRFNSNSKTVNKNKAMTFALLEGFVLLVLFIVGGVMLLETGGESLIGKILLITSIVVSVIQILLGVVLSRSKIEKYPLSIAL